MGSFIDDAKGAGYTDDEINAHIAPWMSKALSLGYSQDDVNKHLGITIPPPFSDNPVAKHGTASHANVPEPVTSFSDALEAGWQISTAGLQLRGKVPDKQVAVDAPWYSRIAGQLATITGDLPAMAVGMGAGAVGGVEAGPPGMVVGALAGGMALPTALRGLMVDAYEKGQFQTFPDFWDRVAPVMIDTAKSWVTGAATGVAGKVAGPALEVAVPALASPAVTMAAKTAAEIGTMVTVGRALEGEVPAARDFMDAAILLGGLKFVEVGAGKLRDIYVKTGIPPKAVLADAENDVTVTQDLMSGKEIPDIYKTKVEGTDAPKSEEEGSVAPPVQEETVRPSLADHYREMIAELDARDATDGEYRDILSTLGKDPLESGETWRDRALRMTEEPLAMTGGGEPPREPPAESPAAVPPPPEPPANIEEARQRIHDHISIGERDTARRFTLDRLYTYVFDRLFPLSRATSEAAKALGESLPETVDNPYRLGRLYAGVVGKAQQMLNHGTFDFNTAEANGPSLRTVLRPVERDLNDFRDFLAARRAIELSERGIETGFDLSSARMLVEQDATRFQATAEALTDYQNRVAAYLRDSGVLSEAAYDAMLEANKSYVPFQRLMDESGITRAVPGGSLTPTNPIKTIEGSERIILDPLESIIRNTYLLTQMAERNAVGTSLVDLLTRANEVTERPTALAGTPETLTALREHGVTAGADDLARVVRATEAVAQDEIRIFRDGRAETFAVDPEVAAAFKGLDRESANLLLRVISAPAQLLRAGATLTPDFMARNLIRDFFSAVINTGGSVFSPIDTARGLASVLRQDEHYQNWLKGGGANAALVSLDRRYMQTSIETLSNETGLMTRSWNVVRHPIEALRYLSETSEQATRVGEFRKVYNAAIDAGKEPKAAMQEAAYSSREVTLDFARMGAKMQAANMMVAFFNAQLQGGDRMVRAFQDKPVSTSLKIAGAITLPSVLLWAANHDDERIKELPAWQRDLFWLYPMDDWQQATPRQTVGVPPYLLRNKDGQIQINNGAILRVPKPFEVGVLFGSGPERILDSLFTDRPEPFKGFPGSVLGALLPGIIPTFALPAVEQFANRSTFSDRTLIPADAEKHLPEYQYTPYTTETAKAIGHLVGAFPGIRDASIEPGTPGGGVARAITSPILMENYLRAWTGNLGVYALQASDLGLRKAGLVPDPLGPTATLADIPFVKAFIARYPSASAESIQTFHDDYAKNKIILGTWQAMAKEGNVDAMRHIAAIGGTAMFTTLDDLQKSLSAHQHIIQNTMKDTRTTPAEKRQLIDTVYWRMIEMARYGNATMAKIRTP